MKNKKLLALMLTCSMILSVASPSITAAAAATDTNPSSAAEKVQPSGYWYDENGDQIDTADMPQTEDGFIYYEIDDETVEISGYTGSGSDIAVPDVINGKKVISIGEFAFANGDKITSVTLPSTVKSIGYNAFYNCSALTEISLPDSVSTIDSYAFSCCSALKSITLPASLRTISDDTFYRCTSLAYVSIPDSVKSIGYEAFSNCSNLTNITVPDSVTSISSWAFEYCSNLSYISIPSSVTSTGYNLFAGVGNVTIYGSKNSAAEKYAADYSIKFVDAAEAAKNFKYSDLTENTVEITEYTGTDKDVFIPEIIDGKRVARIGDSAFKDCKDIVTLALPSSLTSIGFDAFWNCTSLTEITLPDSISEIEGWAFENCTSLKSVVIPKSLTSIGSHVFYNCSSLTDVSLGDSLQRINSGAFYGCSKLSFISVPGSVTYIGYNAFKDCGSLSIYGHINSAAQQYAADNGIAFYNIDKINDNFDYYSWYYGDGWSYTDNVVTITNYKGSDSDVIIPAFIDGKKVIAIDDDAFYSNDEITSVTIPSTVETIGSYAFAWCHNLTEVKIPDSVTSISYSAFYYCESLKSVTIPDSVTHIASSAFGRCLKLEDVKLSESLTQISYGAFHDCYALTSVTIPDSVTSIAENAFENCSKLKSVKLPDSLTSIDCYAFAYCENLESLSIPNSVNAIGENAFYNTKWLKNQTGEFVIVGSNVLLKYNGTSPAVTIPNGVEVLSGGVFAYKDSVNAAALPSTVKTIGSGAFAGCSNLKKINIPNSVTEIGSSAFDGCTSLTEITIPDSVQYLDYDVFEYCESLKKAVIPKSVEYISWSAFYGCSNLTIYGCKDTAAEKHANDNGFAFVDIDETYFQNTSSVNSTELYLGDTLKITGDAKGGSNSYTYAYYYKQSKNSQWRAIGTEFGTATTATLKPTAATSYDIMVKVKSGSETLTKTFTVNVNPEFRNTSSVSTEELYKGGTVDITASATGGVGEAKYAFYYRKSSDSEWTSLTMDENSDDEYAYDDDGAYVSDTKVSFKPSDVGTYEIQIIAKDENGKTHGITYTVTVYSTLINKSTVSTKQLTKGDTLVIKGSASGGNEGYTYAYYYKQSTASVWRSIGTEFGTATQVTLKPSVLTNYDIIVKVKDRTGRIAEKKLTVKVVAPELTNTSSISSTQLTLGDTLTIKGASNGGTGSYKYAYYYKQSKNSLWRAIGTEFGTAASAAFKPTAATDYDILVKVQDSSGTISEKKFTFNVAQVLVNKSTVSTKQLYKGETLTLTGAASGGTGDYKYAFYYKQSKNFQWRAIGTEFGTATSTTFKPTAETDYDILIKVKDKNGKIAETQFKVNVAEVLVNESKVSTTQLAKGSTLTLTGAASGGTGDYKYAFYYKQSSTTGWRAIGDLYGSATSASIKLSNVTNYDIMIRVKDSNGKMAESKFVVTVK